LKQPQVELTPNGVAGNNNTYCLKPQKLKDGMPQKTEWFDEAMLSLKEVQARIVTPYSTSAWQFEQIKTHLFASVNILSQDRHTPKAAMPNSLRGWGGDRTLDKQINFVGQSRP
jgi:hypothetical protein